MEDMRLMYDGSMLSPRVRTEDYSCTEWHKRTR